MERARDRGIQRKSRRPAARGSPGFFNRPEPFHHVVVLAQFRRYWCGYRYWCWYRCWNWTKALPADAYPAYAVILRAAAAAGGRVVQVDAPVAALYWMVARAGLTFACLADVARVARMIAVATIFDVRRGVGASGARAPLLRRQTSLVLARTRRTKRGTTFASRGIGAGVMALTTIGKRSE